MRLLIGLSIFLHLQIIAQSPFIIYNTSNSSIPDNLVNIIYIDAAQNKWIGTQGGLVKIDADNNWTIFNTTNSGLPENDVRSVYVDDENILWVGLFQNGFSQFDGAGWINYNTTNSELPDDYVRAIIKDANDTMWIGSTGGLTKWDGTDEWFTYTISNSEIKSNNITDILIDDTGKKFIGTINGGLTTLDNGTLQYFRTENSGIGDNTVLGLAKDMSDNIWMATAFGGLSIYTPDGAFLNFGISNSDIPEWEVADVAIAEGSLGVLAMNTTGVALFNSISWDMYDAENSDLPDNFLNTIAVDQNNLVWIGTENAGLVTFDYTIAQNLMTIQENQLYLFPNPADGYFFIKGMQHIWADVTIYSAAGAVVLTISHHDTGLPVQITDLPAGLYLVRMQTQEKTCLQLLTVSR